MAVTSGPAGLTPVPRRQAGSVSRTRTASSKSAKEPRLPVGWDRASGKNFFES
jgi:hypothetical protein